MAEEIDGTLQIPEPTKKRQANIQLACRLFCYGLEPTVDGAGKRAGIASTTACNVSQSDGWREFAAKIQSDRIVQDAASNQTSYTLALTPEKTIAIAKELARQKAQIPKLEAEIVRCEEEIAELKPRTAEHSRVIKTITVLRAEIEHLTGLKREHQRQDLIDQALVTVKASKAIGGGASNSDLDSMFDDALRIEGKAVDGGDSAP